jgi:succinyl-diaminopimelate desuccinylase
MLYVMKQLALEGKSYPVGLMLVFDEEIGGENGTQYLLEEGYRGDFFIVGEPTDLALSCASKGILQIQLVATGEAAHAAYQWKGINALDRVLMDYLALREIIPEAKHEVWNTTMNASILHAGGTAVNRVPDNAEMILDIRYIPTEDHEALLNTIRQQVLHSEVVVLHQSPAFVVAEDHPVIVQLSQAVLHQRGSAPVKTREHGATDLRHLTSYGMAGVAFGPVGDDLHGDHEWVDVESIGNYCEILKRFVVGLGEDRA